LNGFLLDTNCISEVVSVRPDSHVLAWMDVADERALHLSVLTLGEIRKGIVTLVEGKRRAQLETWLEIDLRKRFEGRILPVDEATANRWGMLAGDMKRKGRPIPAVDAMIAATALHHNLTVVPGMWMTLTTRR
jgi:predicted nucleic acid-binding protein